MMCPVAVTSHISKSGKGDFGGVVDALYTVVHCNGINGYQLILIFFLVEKTPQLMILKGHLAINPHIQTLKQQETLNL